jgi:phenylacetate-CoA ligase
MTPSYFDELEIRDPHQRDQMHAARLVETLRRAMTAPGWARQLEGVEPEAVSGGRADLARLPLLRKSDLPALQRADPPFGGFNVTPAAKARRLMMSPGPIFEPEGQAADGSGAARALFAASFRPGDVVHNAFSYHLTPGAFILESGLHALGCAVIPGGVGNSDLQAEAIAQFKPSGYVGTPDFLKVLLDTADKSAGGAATSIRRALVSGAALPATLREALGARGVAVLQCYAIAEAGVIAYETGPAGGMVVNEHVVVEIVRPGTCDPVADGEVGEVVVTSFSPDYPMIRLATGDLSAVLQGPSPCGRTNMRIKGWMGRADQSAKIKGMFVHPAQVAEIGRTHRELGRLRLVVTRAGEQDVMTLMAETAADCGSAPVIAAGEGAAREGAAREGAAREGLAAAVAATLQAVTRLRGEVRLVQAGSLPNDGKVIADERGAP